MLRVHTPAPAANAVLETQSGESRELMRQIIVIVAALLAGFVGGVLGTRLSRTGEQYRPERVVRARRFELVDEAGNVIAFWGVDKRLYTVLAFRGPESGSSGGAGSGERSSGLDDPLNQRTAIGLMADSPFVMFRAADGKERMDLSLTPWQKPVLLMDDETGVRVKLGVNHSDTPSAEDNDWALSFQPDRAWIGMFSQAEDGQEYVRGFLSVSKDKVKFPSAQRK